MYTSPRHRPVASPVKRDGIPEGPIHDFWTVIENTPAEEWQRRTSALERLIATIPTGTEYSARDAWYNTPPILRHLANPLSELLKDPRSTVVKRTCECVTDLFAKCQMDARYLLKDIMPTILAVHAQTVQIIRGYVQQMVVESLAVVPCKMAMPLWLDRLKADKSRTVREACALYLGTGLQEWTDEGYLTTEIWMQVGTALVRALRDPAPTVRQNAKKGLEAICLLQRDVFDVLVRDVELTKDVRVKRLLQRILAGESTGDDVSVASSRVGSVAGSVASRGDVYMMI